MADNEKTSTEIASFASEILRMQKPLFATDELWHKIKSVAASALTQAPDKPKESPLLTAHKKQAQYKKYGELKPKSFIGYFTEEK